MLYLLYAVIAGLSDILSGWISLNRKMSGVDARYVIAFASGVLISTAFMEMIPNLSLESSYLALGLGFFIFYVIEKVMMIHSCREYECETHSIGPTAVIGISLDNIVDGIGIAISYLTDPILGLLVTFAVVIHEIPQGMTSSFIMRGAGYSFKKAITILAVAGSLYPIGAYLSSFMPKDLYELALGFVAGDFIYIGAGDLLPEAHRRFNILVVFSVIAGAVLILLLERML